MSAASQQRSAEFLKICGQFQLGVLTTESSHPLTANLSDAAKADTSTALAQLFSVDGDVVKTFREFVQSGRAAAIAQAVLGALRSGGRIFFTGCGSTGRLSIQLVSIWRDFWQRQRGPGHVNSASGEAYESGALSVMAGGDFALIKSVEGFEDFTAFGKKQIADLCVSNKDVVFAITEGGETSFVIGTAWQGVAAGAKVYFVYNNPDEVLCRHVERSREVIAEPRIEKINLTTGPMAITGSTRMQATTIQLCVLLTVLEMVVRELMKELGAGEYRALDAAAVPAQFLNGLTEMQAKLSSRDFTSELAALVNLEEGVYRSGHKNNYFADRFGIDVLTDTTERSPTYCTPPFRKFDDLSATESWAYIFVPCANTADAWKHILKRSPRCIEWTESEVCQLAEPEKAARTLEVVRKIGSGELLRFKVGLDGLMFRQLSEGDCAVAVVAEQEKAALLSPEGFYRVQLEAAQKAGARTGLIYLGSTESISEVHVAVATIYPDCAAVFVEVPETGFLLDGVTRAALKTVLNSLSTCTMVRLGRVMGNYMIWVVPSNLKLIDRSTRYIQKLTGLSYEAANGLLFEVIEYVEPRMKADQAYPPVVGMSVLRARHGLGNEEAEQRLRQQ